MCEIDDEPEKHEPKVFKREGARKYPPHNNYCVSCGDYQPRLTKKLCDECFIEENS